MASESEAVNLEPKKCAITDRLQKRQEERLQQIQQRRTVKDETTVVQETTQYFSENFTKMHSEIEGKVNSYNAEVSEPIERYFSNLLLDVQKLQKYLTDSTSFLSAYEVQKAQTAVNKLKQLIEQKKSEVAPKKKFAFKSDKKKSTSQVPAVTSGPPIDDVQGRAIAFAAVIEPNECGFTDRTNETLTMSASEIDGRNLALSSLSNCRIMLRGAPSTVHANSLNNCTLLCGPTSGSFFIDDCDSCTIVVACQQLRVHRTTKTTFYLHVTSRAIIEDCNGVSFAPYNWQCSVIDEYFRRARIDQQQNNWNCIDDFNWLAVNSPSPNWTVLDVDQRVIYTDDGSIKPNTEQ